MLSHGCDLESLDPRTDPSAFLELKLGDAMVIRNAGGRVSPDVLKELALVGYLFEHKISNRPGRSATESRYDKLFSSGFCVVAGLPG